MTEVRTKKKRRKKEEKRRKKKKKLKKLENNIKKYEKKTCLKSCWGCFGDIFVVWNDPKKLYRGGYDQKKCFFKNDF